MFVFHSFLSKNVVFFIFVVFLKCFILKIFHSFLGFRLFRFWIWIWIFSVAVGQFFLLSFMLCIPSMYRCTIGCKCMVIILMFFVVVCIFVVYSCFVLFLYYYHLQVSFEQLLWYCNWLLVAVVVMSVIASIPLNLQGS